MTDKIIFLDRDGVVNRYPGDREYVLAREEFEIFPYVKECLKRLKEAGFLIFIISNQACVSKGLISEEKLKVLTDYMLSAIEGEASEVDGIYYCIHQDEDNCPFRKPEPALINEVLKKQGLDKNNLTFSPVFIGDSIRDVKTAHRAGITSILVLSGREKLENEQAWEEQPDYICKDLQEATEFILKHLLPT